MIKPSIWVAKKCEERRKKKLNSYNGSKITNQKISEAKNGLLAYPQFLVY